MKLVFLDAGKYRLGINVVVITPEDVESETVFTVAEERARELVDAKRATEIVQKAKEQPPAPITLEDVNKMSVAELKDYATKNTIDLGEATVKADILETVVKSFEVKED